MPVRIVIGLLAAFAVATPAASQPARPLGSKTVGPWEAVSWGAGTLVEFCTLVRVDGPAGAPSYGLLVDRKGTLFSIETADWSLPNRPVEAGVAAVVGRARVLAARPVSQRRVNIDLTRHPDVVTELRGAERVEVSIEGTTVQLAFDGFDKAHDAHRECVGRIGSAPPG